MSKKKPSLEDLEKMGSQEGAEEEVHKKFWHYFKKNKSKITFAEKVERIYDLLVSGKLSKQDKAIIIGALIYFINPLDLIPDITPFIGFLDDLGVIGLAYRYLINRADEE